MPGDTITPFFGEFMTNGIPLEWSGNYCSHACPYCFANLNSQHRQQKDKVPLRYADVKATMNLLRDYHKRDSLEAFWLREGYPVLMSNKVDPFSNSNFRTVLPLLELMTELEIPLAFQTRGGRGIDEALQFLKPAVWYISIEHSDDATRQTLAPANPSIESRYELIQKLHEAGHKVVLGLNPLSLEWAPQPEIILQRCYELGVKNVWIELLHFNKDQINIARQQGKVPESMLLRYEVRKRRNHSEAFDHLLRTRQIALEMGYETYGTGQTTYSRYWDIYKSIYPKLLPTFQDWVNHCHDQGWDNDKLITFDEFVKFFLPLLPKGCKRLGHYVGSACHDIPAERGKDWTNWMSWSELLRISWSDPRLKWCPVRAPAFAYIPNEDYHPKRNRGAVLRDEKGMPYIAFWRQYQEFLLEEV